MDIVVIEYKLCL